MFASCEGGIVSSLSVELFSVQSYHLYVVQLQQSDFNFGKIINNLSLFTPSTTTLAVVCCRM